MRSTIALSATMIFVMFGAWTANLVCAAPQIDTSLAVAPISVAWQ
jgi:hypothetical protein